MPTNTPNSNPIFQPTTAITTRSAVSAGIKSQSYFPRIDKSVPHTVQRHLQLIYNRLYNHALAFSQIINGQTSVVTTSTAATTASAAASSGSSSSSAQVAASIAPNLLSATPISTRVRTRTLGPGVAQLARTKANARNISTPPPGFGLTGALLPGRLLSTQSLLTASAGVAIRPYLAVTAAYTIDPATDFQIDCTAGSFAVTLPPAASTEVGQIFSVKDSGPGSITLAASGTDLIDGQSTQPLKGQYSNITVMNTGTGWIIVATV